jgi:hypothetical protein
MVQATSCVLRVSDDDHAPSHLLVLDDSYRVLAVADDGDSESNPWRSLRRKES